MSSLIPVTLLTGFLVCGKTTLLNYILQAPHGHKIAVIENEYGEVGIDNALLVHDQEQIVEMNNGCICCTVRGDLQRILGEFAVKKASGALHFDRVIIETTGLANPGPVAQTFYADETIRQHYVLDAILTVVDAKHAMQQLDTQAEAQAQVGFADRLLLSKTDLVDESTLAPLKARLLKMNPRAKIQTLLQGAAPLDKLLDLNSFNLHSKLEFDPHFLSGIDDHSASCAPDCGHNHDHSHDHGHDHAHHHDHHGHDHGHAHHDDAVKAFVYRTPRAFDLNKFEACMGGLLQQFGPDLFRYKGLLYFAKEPRQAVLQGVHMTMDSSFGRRWNDGEAKSNTIVFIGRNLPQDLFEAELDRCLFQKK